MTYAYYRLPYADTYTVVASDSEPQVLSTYESIGDEAGFVIAPFCMTEKCPIVMIRPDFVENRKLRISSPSHFSTNDGSGEKTVATEAYSMAFNACSAAVNSGIFHKLVLARNHILPYHTVSSDECQRLFERTCRLYPRLTIILFSTPLTGTWLIASPEILIEGEGSNYHTVALAGTMPYCDGYADWSGKNKREQHVVEEYVAENLQPFAIDIITDGPVTMRAGNLLHLRTDFRFHLRDGVSLGKLVGRLHPTPAVCGFPKQESREFILRHEGLERRYYSGFAGPVGIGGETHLYVSLRCAELRDDTATLYAGSGIMPESMCLQEWHETEEKMRTIGTALC